VLKFLGGDGDGGFREVDLDGISQLERGPRAGEQSIAAGGFEG
jgi:hypothetical protein